MPLTAKGSKILSAMEKRYGPKKGKSVFYASINSGRISGVEGHAAGGQVAGLVDHPDDPELPPVQDDVRMIPLMPGLVQTLIENQRQLSGGDNLPPDFFLRRDRENVRIPSLRRGRRHRRGSPPPPDGHIEELFDVASPHSRQSPLRLQDGGGCDGGGGCGSCEGSCGGSWGDSGTYSAGGFDAAGAIFGGPFDASVFGDAAMSGVHTGGGDWGSFAATNYSAFDAPNAVPFVDPNPGVTTGGGDWGSAGTFSAAGTGGGQGGTFSAASGLGTAFGGGNQGGGWTTPGGGNFFGGGDFTGGGGRSGGSDISSWSSPSGNILGASNVVSGVNVAGLADTAGSAGGRSGGGRGGGEHEGTGEARGEGGRGGSTEAPSGKPMSGMDLAADAPSETPSGMDIAGDQPAAAAEPSGDQPSGDQPSGEQSSGDQPAAVSAPPTSSREAPSTTGGFTWGTDPPPDDSGGRAAAVSDYVASGGRGYDAPTFDSQQSYPGLSDAPTAQDPGTLFGGTPQAEPSWTSYTDWSTPTSAPAYESYEGAPYADFGDQPSAAPTGWLSTLNPEGNLNLPSTVSNVPTWLSDLPGTLWSQTPSWETLTSPGTWLSSPQWANNPRDPWGIQPALTNVWDYVSSVANQFPTGTIDPMAPLSDAPTAQELSSVEVEAPQQTLNDFITQTPEVQQTLNEFVTQAPEVTDTFDARFGEWGPETGTLPSDMFPGARVMPVERSDLPLANPYADILDTGGIAYPTSPDTAYSRGANPQDVPGWYAGEGVPTTTSAGIEAANAAIDAAAGAVVEAAEQTGAPPQAGDAAAQAAAEAAANGASPADQAAAAAAAAEANGATPGQAQAIADSVYSAASGRSAPEVSGRPGVPPGLLFETLMSPEIRSFLPSYDPANIAAQAVANAFTQPGPPTTTNAPPAVQQAGPPSSTPGAPPPTAPPGTVTAPPTGHRPGVLDVREPSLSTLFLPGGRPPADIPPQTATLPPAMPPEGFRGVVPPGTPGATLPPGTFPPAVEPGEPGAPPSYTPSVPPVAQPPQVATLPPQQLPPGTVTLPPILPRRREEEREEEEGRPHPFLGREPRPEPEQPPGAPEAGPGTRNDAFSRAPIMPPGQSHTNRPPATPAERAEFTNWWVDTPRNPNYQDRGLVWGRGVPGSTYRTAQQAGVRPLFETGNHNWQDLSQTLIEALNRAYNDMPANIRGSFILNSGYRPDTRAEARALGMSDYQSQESVFARGHPAGPDARGANRFDSARPGRSRHAGTAVDVRRGEARDWLHRNAARYGLTGILGGARGSDPAHFQLTGPPAGPSRQERQQAEQRIQERTQAVQPGPPRPAADIPLPPARPPGQRTEAPGAIQLAGLVDEAGAPPGFIGPDQWGAMPTPPPPGTPEWEAQIPENRDVPLPEAQQPSPPVAPQQFQPAAPGRVLDPSQFQQRQQERQEQQQDWRTAPIERASLMDRVGAVLGAINPISTAEARGRGRGRDADVISRELARQGGNLGGQPGRSIVGNKVFSFYGPGASGQKGTEGPMIGSQGNALTTLDDVRNGAAFVSLAGHPDQFGQQIFIGNITYTSPIDGRQYTLQNVFGRVDDTGSDFRGNENPYQNKFDIAVGDFGGKDFSGKSWNDTTAGKFVANNVVTAVPGRGLGSDIAARSPSGLLTTEPTTVGVPGGFAQGGLVDMPGYYEEGGETEEVAGGRPRSSPEPPPITQRQLQQELLQRRQQQPPAPPPDPRYRELLTAPPQYERQTWTQREVPHPTWRQWPQEWIKPEETPRTGLPPPQFQRYERYFRERFPATRGQPIPRRPVPPAEAVYARGGLVNDVLDPSDMMEMRKRAVGQTKQIMRAVEPGEVAESFGFARGGLTAFGAPQMNTFGKQAHFGGLNALRAARPAVQRLSAPSMHLISSSVPGRTDRIPMRARTGSYIIPADVVSGLGQGNTSAGAKMWGQTVAHAIGPYGMQNAMKRRTLKAPSIRMPTPRVKYQQGGEVDDEYTPIITAGGEIAIDPEIVEELGGGDAEAGKRMLAESVTKVRKQVISHLKSLPRPVK